MDQKQVNRLIKFLKASGITFDEGLTEEEIREVENKFEIRFPDDLRLFIKTKLPVSEGFVNWRSGIRNENEKKTIFNRIEGPLEGMLFDIDNNEFWLESWGLKPDRYEVRKKIATEEFQKYPKLIPIYSHRYISSEPHDAGNPVFSVYQMDIIHYGMDLADYFSNEFKFDLPKSFGVVTIPTRIEFWSDMIDLNNQ